MAILNKHIERESWIQWAREFVRRGLWPSEFITVHGPHAYPGDYMWGEALCRRDSDPDHDNLIEVDFASRRPCQKWYVVRNVLMWCTDVEWYEPNETFPVLKPSQLSKNAQWWLKTAKRVLDSYRKERKQIRRRR